MKRVMLSFDVEEFDMPLEYGKNISFEDQIRISSKGAKIILDILSTHGITATFFSTVMFARHAKDLIQRIKDEGHEIASHGYFHSRFENAHLLDSKLALEEISGQQIKGFRMARMMPVDAESIAEAGYTYNSSLNPVYLPGRYNNFFKPRTLFKTDKIIQLPASATPYFRFPLFWLSFHNVPLWLYKIGCTYAMNSDNYLNIYFHPWEFTDLEDPAYGLPKYVSRNSGQAMTERFNAWVSWMKYKGYRFNTIAEFVMNY